MIREAQTARARTASRTKTGERRQTRSPGTLRAEMALAEGERGSSKRARKSEEGARRDRAAGKIARAFRRYRAQFPARSASPPRIYQDDSRIAGELARAFASGLEAFARKQPEQRTNEINEALRARALAAAPGMVRAAHVPATSRFGFTQGTAGRWAAEGYARAREHEQRVADLTGAEINYILLRLQREEAPRIAAGALGDPHTVLLRTEARRKSLSPKHGAKVRELVWARDGEEAVVGAPGDTFRLAADTRRFLAHALGGLQRYQWRMNPRRRTRIAKAPRAKRWIMHSNLGVSAKSLYVWMREMHGWSERMAPRRNWKEMYPRPLVLKGAAAPRLGASLRDILRRHLFGVLDEPRSPPSRTAAAALSAYAQAARQVRRAERERAQGRSASPGSFLPGVSRTRPRRAPRAGTRVAGILGDGAHAGVFVIFARPRAGGWVLQMAVLDPLGAVTFAPAVQEMLRRELAAAVRDVGMAQGGERAALVGPVLDVRVALLPVPRALAVQYANEGACGPSSIALLLALLRAMKPLDVAAASPADAAVLAFKHVTDEDVVIAAQLHHNGVL